MTPDVRDKCGRLRSVPWFEFYRLTLVYIAIMVTVAVILLAKGGG